MIYKNKNTELLKSKLSENAGANAILAKVKEDKLNRDKQLGIKKPSLVSRVVAGKQGKVLGSKTDSAGKAIENLEDKQLGVKKASDMKIINDWGKMTPVQLQDMLKKNPNNINLKKFMQERKVGV